MKTKRITPEEVNRKRINKCLDQTINYMRHSLYELYIQTKGTTIRQKSIINSMRLIHSILIDLKKILAEEKK